MLLTPTAPLATSLLAGLVKVRAGDGSGPTVPGLDSHGGLTLQTQDTATGATPFTLKAIANQTGLLQSWQDSAGNVLGSIAATGEVALTPNMAPLSTGGSGVLPAAVAITNTPIVIASNTVGGVDENVTTDVYLAQRFFSGPTPPLEGAHAVILSLKCDSTFNTGSAAQLNGGFTITLYSDAAGLPGSSLASIGLVSRPSQIGLTYASHAVALAYFNQTVTLTANTWYWAVVKMLATSVGNLWCDSRTDVGTSVVATSPDGITWTAAAGTKTLVYSVVTRTKYALNQGFGGSTDAGPNGGIYVVNPTGSSVYGRSDNMRAIQGDSIIAEGGLFTSVYTTALRGASTYGNGVHGTTVLGVGISTAVGGTLVANTVAAPASGNNMIAGSRSGTTNGFNQDSALMYLNDMMTQSSGGVNTSPLIWLGTASTAQILVDRGGALKVGHVAPTWGVGRVGISVITQAPTVAGGTLSATGGNLVNGAVYRYVQTVLGSIGSESSPSAELIVTIPAGGTGTSGSVTINLPVASAYGNIKLYRTAANGNRGAWTDLVASVAAGTASIADTGVASTGTAPLVTNTNLVGGWDTVAPYGFIAPYYSASTNRAALTIYGLFGASTGWGPIDGSTTGKFAGSANGTYIGINTGSGFAGDMLRFQLFGADRYQMTSAGLTTQTASDAGTNTSVLAQTIYHKSSGTPAANFGAGLLFQLDSANNTKRSAIQINAAWSVATDTSQTSYLAFQTVNAGGALTEALRVIPAGLNGPLTTTLTDAGTNTQPLVGSFAHRSSGTPAANFGTTLKLQADSSNNTLRDLAALVGQWTTATDASQASQLAFQLVSAGGALTTALTLAPLALTPKDGMNIVLGTTTGTQIGTGTTQKLSFYGSAPVVKATVSGAKGSNAALGSLMTALAALGLVTDSTSA